jgi:CreA protein
MKSNFFYTVLAVMFGSCLLSSPVGSEEIGRVSTTFKVIGANDKIVIEAFDDPDIPGATCYVSRAKTGGISGALGVAEDKSDASLACRQTGPIRLGGKIILGKENGRRVFKKSTSLLFKKLQVVRFYDRKRNVLVYLSYSDKLVEGSPKNSISTIVIRPWKDATGHDKTPTVQ